MKVEKYIHEGRSDIYVSGRYINEWKISRKLEYMKISKTDIKEGRRDFKTGRKISRMGEGILRKVGNLYQQI